MTEQIPALEAIEPWLHVREGLRFALKACERAYEFSPNSYTHEALARTTTAWHRLAKQIAKVAADAEQEPSAIKTAE
jgi:hypothetical protein